MGGSRSGVAAYLRGWGWVWTGVSGSEASTRLIALGDPLDLPDKGLPRSVFFAGSVAFGEGVNSFEEGLRVFDGGGAEKFGDGAGASDEVDLEDDGSGFSSLIAGVV
jgi:hypothetical protein